MITLTVVVALEMSVVVGAMGGAMVRMICDIHRLPSHTPHAPVIVGRGAEKWVMRSPTAVWRITSDSPQPMSRPILRALPSKPPGRLHVVPRDSPPDHVRR